MAKFVCLYILLLFLRSATASLELVIVLARHGDRSPTETYPKDPYVNYSWPNGLGQLSNKGKIEMYELGLTLRTDYNNFLGDLYVHEEVIAYTSYADRCHMSAQLLLAGLYPPQGEQIWNSELIWQPIPLHEYMRNEDDKIAMKKPCPMYDSLLKNVYFSEDVITLNEYNEQLYKYLSEHSGLNINDVLSLEFLYNTLEIEALNNLTLPDWTNSVFPDKMKKLSAISLALFTETTLMKQLHGGPLLKEIMENMKMKILNLNKRKFILYSGHDVTIVTLLRTLGFEELLKPEFAASVIIELHKIDNDYFVQIFYKNNPFTLKEKLTLAMCGEPCEFVNMEITLKDVIPENWENECLIK